MLEVQLNYGLVLVRNTNLFIDFPLVLNGVTSELPQCTLTKGIVQNKHVHVFKGFAFFFFLSYFTLHALDVHTHFHFVHRVVIDTSEAKEEPEGLSKNLAESIKFCDVWVQALL